MTLFKATSNAILDALGICKCRVKCKEYTCTTSTGDKGVDIYESQLYVIVNKSDENEQMYIHIYSENGEVRVRFNYEDIAHTVELYGDIPRITKIYFETAKSIIESKGFGKSAY